jgi:prolyl-tRNA editing enzyme YbaK/EbsC (Cys-tRNA(Pro) deacylase)
MLTTDDLQAFIDAHQIAARVVHPPFPTPTVPDAAEAMGVAPDAIIKSVLFIVRRTEPLLVIASGEGRIDQRVIADRLGVGKKQVRIATPEQVEEWTGYPAGGVPPFGHGRPLPTWIDPAVLEQPVVYGGGGDEQTLLRIETAALLPVTQAEVIAVCN